MNTFVDAVGFSCDLGTFWFRRSLGGHVRLYRGVHGHVVRHECRRHCVDTAPSRLDRKGKSYRTPAIFRARLFGWVRQRGTTGSN